MPEKSPQAQQPSLADDGPDDGTTSIEVLPEEAEAPGPVAPGATGARKPAGPLPLLSQTPLSAPLPLDAPVPFSAAPPSRINQVVPAPPERYGKYNLLERIGVGGMAEVWRAKTLGTEGFTKDLVIKRILPRYCRDKVFIEQFTAEARLVARLQHANVVQVFDFDKEGDTYYLAMELVEGRDLRQLQKVCAKDGTWFPLAVSIYLIAEALKGLHYAHTKTEHGKPLLLVHRDISPHNILLSFAGEVKISDFGIAKVAARVGKTQDGMVKGKLAYMSPEQIAGRALDCRTDIYSMGVVFWELLTQNRLFVGPSEVDVIRRVRDAVVPPPRQYNPELPEELERVVMKMLAGDRAARYAAAGDVVRDLCALSCYSYEAQALGDLLRKLFPEQKRAWTMMLQSLNANAAKTTDPDNRDSESAPPPPRSKMAGSDQKTVMATPLPPEVKATLGNSSQAAPAAATQPAPPPLQRTVIAEAPPAANLPPPGSKLPPPPAGNLPPPPLAGGLPPPPAAGAPAAPAKAGAAYLSPQATVMMEPGAAATVPPSGRSPSGAGTSMSGRPAAPPLPLRPAAELFAAAAPQPAGPPAYLRWLLGGLLLAVTAVLAMIVSNRVFPPGLGQPRGPSLFARKASVRIVSDPAGAKVLVDGVEQPEKTPMEVHGDVGKKARVQVRLAGYDPYEAVIPFTRDERPPLNVRLLKEGSRAQGKEFDKSLYEDRPGTRTREEPDEDQEAQQAAEAKKAQELAATEEKKKAEAAAQDKEEKEEAPAADHHKRHRRGQGKEAEEGAPVKVGKGKATLTVTVRPWAIVYLDGRKLKQTPLRDFQLSPGKHTLLLQNDTRGKRESVPLTVNPGAAVTISRDWD